MSTINQLIEPSFSIGENQNPYEIIYADPRNEEIHLQILEKAQLNAHMARWFLDLEYNHLLWSNGVYEILEIDSKKSGASYDIFLEIIHPEDRAIKEEAQKALFETRKPMEITYRLQMNDGRIKWINEICSADFDQNENPIRIHGIIQDITGYKRSEKKFLQKEKDYKALMNLVPAGIAIYQNKKIIFVNPAVIHILGAKGANELIGQPVTKFVDSDSIKNFQKKMDQAAHGIPSSTFEEKLFRLNGSVFDAQITPFHTINNEAPAVQVIVIDITIDKENQRLRKNELHLKELIATKDKFLSIIAHDLRSPFNSVIGFLELLLSEYDEFNDLERKENISLILENANITLNLLENLLIWAKAQTGRIAFQPVKQKLISILNSVNGSFNSVINHKELTLKISISDDIEIFADTNMLNSIFQNLVSNAIKYSREGGTILINVVQIQNQIEINISDNGVGMSKETINKLFKIGEDISIPGTCNEKGSGLGLILCKDFVERHNGSIFVESELGKGSQFIIRLPQI